MRRALLAVPLLLASCAEPPPPVAPPPPPAPPATVSAVPTASAAPSAAPAAPPRVAARLGAPVDGRFGLVVRCIAPGFGSVHLWPVGKGVLGMCGFAVDASAVFHVPEGGPPRLAPEVFKDLPMRATRDQALFGIDAVSGADLEHLEASVSELMTRSGYVFNFRKVGKTWKKTGTEVFEGSDFYCSGNCVELSGHALVNYPDPDGVARFRYLGEHKGWMPPEARVPGCARPVSGFRFLGLRGKDRKELWGIGAACGKLAAQRWTVGGADTAAQAIDLPAGEFAPGSVGTFGDTWIYTAGDRQVFALFDGKTWSPLLAADKSVNLQLHTLKGRFYAQIDRGLHRLEGTKLIEIGVPDKGIESLHTSPSGEVRVWTGQGLYAFGDDEVWHPVTLPDGFKQLTGLSTVGDRWRYEVMADPRSDQHAVLVEGVTGAPLEITDPNHAISPMAYVRGYTQGCENPFAMLYKLSRVAPRDYDFPATKKALEGQPELAAGRFSEVEALGDRYLVVQFPGAGAVLKLGRLVKLVEKQVQGSKPQLLCADALRNGLPTTRDVHMK
jgi:hypothetical protein